MDNGYENRMFCLAVKEIAGKALTDESHLCTRLHPHDGNHACLGCGEQWPNE